MPYALTVEPPQYGLTALAEQLLPVLYRHRLMTTGQLHRLLQPHVVHPTYLRRQLTRLRERGLVDAVVRNRGGGQGQQAWYCTPAGADVVEAARELTARPYRMTEHNASSQLQEHTLAVNDTGIAFVEAARAAGHDCGPLDWEPEVAHRFRDGEARADDDAFLTPDAVLSYVQRNGPRATAITYFLEIDRATEGPAQLADKLRAYARYQTYIPTAPVASRARPDAGGEAWRGRYATFPLVLFVLTGATEAAMMRRAADVRALAAADSRLRRAAHRLPAGITTLRQLQKPGPWEPVVIPVFGNNATPTDALSYAQN